MSSARLAVSADPQLKITAKLTDSDGNPLPGKPIYFYKSTDRSNWYSIGSAVTDSNGEASVYDEIPSQKTYYRAVFNGDDEYEGSSAETYYQPQQPQPQPSKPKTEIPWWIIILLLLLLLFAR